MVSGPARPRGAKKVIVTTDEPGKPNRRAPGRHTEVWHRDRLDEAQSELAATPGTTVLLHDQECAAELRRAGSRGKAESRGRHRDQRAGLRGAAATAGSSRTA